LTANTAVISNIPTQPATTENCFGENIFIIELEV
jgi:hypothetical protein